MKARNKFGRALIVLLLPVYGYTQQITTDTFLHRWSAGDLATDSVPGISLAKAYTLIKNKKGQTVIVAVIDSGIDIWHEDLKGNIWTNKKEIPANGKDDDHNGYSDDVHGWNFLGGKQGNMYHAQLESTRIVKKYSALFDGKSIDEIPDSLKAPFKQYLQLKKELETAIEDYSKMYTREVANYINIPGREQQRAYIQFLESKIRFHLNLEFDPREIVGDNPDDLTDTIYGNNDVVGFKTEEQHGTHVAGIIAASRGNGKGIDGIAQNVKIMPLRVVPDGDEYDKDVALAIRYAVNNGAKVINMSFGKRYSVHSDWVFEAIKYAESKDVLIVHGAGNDSKNIDKSDNFPNDSKDKSTEFSDNVITVGAVTRFYNEGLIAAYSNYGKLNVDLFAPGSEIYSTVPDNKYQMMNGTSMAAPAVSGVAVLVRSYYPWLTASQVKHIIMDSGTKLYPELFIPGSNNKTKFINVLSVSGKMLNAFNALIMAEEMSQRR